MRFLGSQRAAHASTSEAVMKGAAFEGTSIPMLIVDRDLVITFVNSAYRELLAKHLSTFRSFWPSISVENIVGTCIDGFHKNPAHQRALLSDLSRMPYRTDISVGEMKFALNVSAVRDATGAHVGSVLEWVDVSEARVNAGVIEAINQNQAVLELSLDGDIQAANDNAQQILGYRLAELRHQPISRLNAGRDATSISERAVWERLRRGEAVSGKYLLRAQDGQDIWFSAILNPICDISKKVYKVVALMTDITEAEVATFQQTAIIDAVSGQQGMIEFDLQGRILKANQNLCTVMGYSEAEILGRPHSTFVEPAFAASPEYRQMWERLGRGESISSGTFKRLAKGGRVVYLQGAYTPVRDHAGNIARVVKMATDVTVAETERLAGLEQRAAMEAEQARVVEQLSGALSSLAGGDLTMRISEPFAAEYETLRANFNEAVEKLEGALSAVVLAAENIRHESGQVTQAADDLSHRTENQAAALEETAASLEELTASVKAAAVGAEKASVDVTATKQSAEESGRIVREAVDAMSEIEKSSQHISQIIGVIDDIAFQTNLLALNAGVEAARAGDAGRGFAVVASEVRALAQRSSDAAKEIKALISTSSQQVGRGVDLVGETGKSLQTIVAAVTGITALIAEIATSSREQSVGLSEINTAINQLDQVTQQNAAMVEESTAASHAMKTEAESLASLIAQFKTDLAHAPGGADVTRLPVRAPDGKKAPARAAAAERPARSNGSAALATKKRSTLDEWQEF